MCLALPCLALPCLALPCLALPFQAVEKANTPQMELISDVNLFVSRFNLSHTQIMSLIAPHNDSVSARLPLIKCIRLPRRGLRVRLVCLLAHGIPRPLV